MTIQIPLNSGLQAATTDLEVISLFNEKNTGGKKYER